MRAPHLVAALTFASLAAPTAVLARPCAGEIGRLCGSGSVVHRHLVRHGVRRHIARGYHIPRFDQGAAEAYVHTVYPYRTGLYVPWPDAYGAPYPY